MASPVNESADDRVAADIRIRRQARNWTAGDLADRCAKAGYPGITRAVIANIESGRRDEHGRRRRGVTAGEIAAFAAAFSVEPWSLFFDALRSEGEQPSWTGPWLGRDGARLLVSGEVTISVKKEGQ